MNDIPRGTPRIKLINSLLSPPHEARDTSQPADVIFGLIMSDSRLDDEQSVASIEFSSTPMWLQRLNDDPYGFPKRTALGTLWRGVDPTALDAHGRTAFMTAVMSGAPGFLYAEMLAELEATDVNVQDAHGRTALHWACAAQPPKKKLVALCLSVPECQIGLLDNDGLTAFDIAMRAGNEKISAMFYRSVFEMEDTHPQQALLRVLTITSEPESGRPVFPGAALFEPVEDGNSPLVRALVGRGVDLAARNAKGETALHVAVQCRNVDIAAVLLEAGSDAAAEDGDGRTVLQVAEDQQLDMVGMLAKYVAVVPVGPIVVEESNVGWDTSILERDGDAVGALIATGEDFEDLLHPAAKNGCTEMVGVVVAHGANIRAGGSNEFTALHLAAMSGSPGALELLLSGGALINATATCGITALHLAAVNGKSENINLLLAHGADIDASSNDRFLPRRRPFTGNILNTVGIIDGNRYRYDSLTPLHLAAWNGHTRAVDTLLTHGANVEPRILGDVTALLLAAVGGHGEIVKLLLFHGAYLESTMPQDCVIVGQRRMLESKTAVQLASMMGHDDVVAMLVAAGAHSTSIGRLGHSLLKKLKGKE